MNDYQSGYGLYFGSSRVDLAVSSFEFSLYVGSWHLLLDEQELKKDPDKELRERYEEDKSYYRSF
ncbi:hypothetical protein [Candidatus Electrothrix sp.]|uniref:hypothetical protein n=1 Tax=Candidatus Electrothrix sp. TaxID=2170559 RepID=UPI004056BCC3